MNLGVYLGEVSVGSSDYLGGHGGGRENLREGYPHGATKG